MTDSSAWAAMNLARAECGLTKKHDKICTHTLRHSYATHMLDAGTSLRQIRHYGYLGSAARKTRLYIRALLGEPGEPAPKLPEPVPFTCDCCGGLLTFLREIKPIYLMRGPPRRPPPA